MLVTAGQQVPPRLAAIETVGVWFGDPARPALGWLTRRAGPRATSGVLILPPTGYAYTCSHRALRGLAEQLAASGHTALRIDYDGTGDSAGDQWDTDRVDSWRRTIRDAAAELRRLGVERLILVGARLGATLALLDAAELEADRVVAWLPISRGRRYAKELRLLSDTVPADQDPLKRKGTRVVAGNVFADQTVRDITNLTLTDIDRQPAPAVLIIDDATGSSADAVQRLRRLGTAVDDVELADGGDVLETPPEYGYPSEQIVDRSIEWIGEAPLTSASAPLPELRSRATISWRERRVTEEVLSVGPEGHAAILTSPERPDPDRTTLVLLNPGSETHIGPGRAWVEYARDLALSGRRTIRIDFLGWGESPGAGGAPGRPYDARCVPDAVSIVRHLREAGHQRIALGGLCASAWVALAAAREVELDGIIAINPQLYWKIGDPVEIDWDVIRGRRALEITRIDRGARLGAWSILDAVGVRPRAGRWLDELVAGPARVELIFAEGDDGLVFLQRRLGRQLQRLRRQGRVGVQELADVDHPMHLTWLRPRIVAALTRSLQAIDDRRAA